MCAFESTTPGTLACKLGYRYELFAKTYDREERTILGVDPQLGHEQVFCSGAFIQPPVLRREPGTNEVEMIPHDDNPEVAIMFSRGGGKHYDVYDDSLRPTIKLDSGSTKYVGPVPEPAWGLGVRTY